MLTTAEAAEILGVQPTSVRVWLNEEGHPRFPNAQKFGRDWQIPESDLANLPRGRGRGRPDQFGIYSPSYHRAAARPGWADMSIDERISALISEIEQENVGKNAPLHLPDRPEERREHARRIIAKFERDSRRERAFNQRSSNSTPAKLKFRKASKDIRKKTKPNRKGN